MVARLRWVARKPARLPLRSRPRPESEWRTLRDESLRINQSLWERVQARLAEVQEAHGYAGLRQGPNTTYLLTGFLRCGTCGANLVIVTGRGKQGHRSYGCPQNYYRGACQKRSKSPSRPRRSEDPWRHSNRRPPIRRNRVRVRPISETAWRGPDRDSGRHGPGTRPQVTARKGAHKSNWGHRRHRSQFQPGRSNWRARAGVAGNH